MVQSVLLNMLGKSRKTLEWEKARRKLKKIYENKGIVTCEIRFLVPHTCTYSNFLSFAHRYKRSDPQCEHTFEQTILACTNGHQEIEYNRDLTNEVFEKLRP